jgi:hypothetical protein
MRNGLKFQGNLFTPIGDMGAMVQIGELVFVRAPVSIIPSSSIGGESVQIRSVMIPALVVGCMPLTRRAMLLYRDKEPNVLTELEKRLKYRQMIHELTPEIARLVHVSKLFRLSTA